MIRENTTFLDAFTSVALMFVLGWLTVTQVIQNSSDPGVMLLIWVIVFVLSPFLADIVDKDYYGSLFDTEKDTEKFPASLFTIRFYFLFAWVIPHLFVLIVNKLFYAVIRRKIFIRDNK
jgi:chromate transport protein ChrA